MDAVVEAVVVEEEEMDIEEPVAVKPVVVEPVVGEPVGIVWAVQMEPSTEAVKVVGRPDVVDAVILFF